MRLRYLTSNNNLHYEFQNVSPTKIWEKMSECEGFKEAYWFELTDIFKTCLRQVAKLELPKYIHSKEHIQKYYLDYGFDFNHIDGGGNTYLKYALSSRRSSSSDYKKLLMTKGQYELIDFFAQFMKPELIHKKNDFGETVLFDLLHPADTGMDGKRFFKVLDQYPELSKHLHDKNKHNYNLLNKCLSDSNIHFAPYLLEKGLSYTHKYTYNSYSGKTVFDKNILDHFVFFAAHNDTVDLFNLFIQKVDICPNRKDTFFNTMLEWSISEGVHQETRIKCYDWLEVISENIENKTFLQTKNNLARMHKKLYDFSFKESSNMNEDLSKVVLNLLFIIDKELSSTLYPDKTTSKKMKL